MSTSEAHLQVDPIKLEVTKNALASITDEMCAALQRTAYSTNIKTRLDFSCAIFDAELRVVAQALAQPSHLGSLPHSVPNALREYGLENLRPGDALIMNDPHRGAVHLNDIALISPFFLPDGQLLGVVANVAHHVDVGGSAPGSLAPARELYQEGLVLPPLRFVEGGRINPEIMRLIAANFRAPRESAGDFRAQVSANNLGSRRLRELVERLGVDEYRRLCDELIAYTTRRTREALAALPHGEFSAEDYLDGDGIVDEPIRIVVTVRVGDDGVVVDLTGTDAQCAGSANCSSSMAFSGIAFVLKTLVDPSIPINHGFYHSFQVILPEGTVVNARRPAAVGAGWEVAYRVAETLYRAFSPALPERVVAATKGTICNVSFGGRRPDGGYYAYYETVAGGGGARSSKAGMDAIQSHIHNTENAPVEEVELSYPFRIRQVGLIPDSEGAGRFRGGLGVRRDYWFPNHQATVSVLADRGRFAPWGLFGGEAARRFHFVRDPEGRAVELPSKASIHLDPGETVSIQTPGGGGYGPPAERDPVAVLRDVQLGKVSIQRAREVYRVAIDSASLTVDDAATGALRSPPVMLSRSEASPLTVDDAATRAPGGCGDGSIR
ncbi:MAG: hydantoinase B/oxoprolinase family protein [Chloroflexi bacterium]|nr:hydantoinase B/oxoprolinase family protein [Chloroflexota bacterium]